MKKLNALFTSLLVLCCGTSYGAPLEVGAAVPPIKTVDQNGDAVDLEAELKDGLALVYFYPKADTPGCTKQACNLRDAFEEVSAAGIKVFGVSADSAADQLAFIEKYELPFTLLADSEKKVIEAFGVPTLNAKGYPARQTFLVQNGKVIWRDLAAKPATQAQDALAAAKNAAKG